MELPTQFFGGHRPRDAVAEPHSNSDHVRIMSAADQAAPRRATEVCLDCWPYPLLAASGLPRVRFHDLLHTAATLLLEASVHPRVVAERLGHATPALVMNTYGHATERMQKDATAALERILGA